MISLVDGGDYALLFLLTTVVGGIGGFVYDLLQLRGTDTGAIELPKKLSGRYRDLGVIASIIVGAVAATAAIWVFPPTERILESGTVREYRYDQLIPLSLIVGSAGSSFLAAFQARALARVKEQEADQTLRIANAALDQVSQPSEGVEIERSLLTQVDTARAMLTALREPGAE